MAPAASPPATLLADIAAGDLASLYAHLSGRRTRGSLNARLDTEKQDTLVGRVHQNPAFMSRVLSLSSSRALAASNSLADSAPDW